MRTPLRPTQIVLIKGVSLFRGLFYIHEITFGTTHSVHIIVDVRISGVSARRDSTVHTVLLVY